VDGLTVLDGPKVLELDKFGPMVLEDDSVELTREGSALELGIVSIVLEDTSLKAGLKLEGSALLVV
jgi:hypothetical protein